jgi:hypothetical protein
MADVVFIEPVVVVFIQRVGQQQVRRWGGRPPKSGQTLGWDTDARTQRLFEWKHIGNAFGPSPMWVAAEGTTIVGLRAFMRWEFNDNGRRIPFVRAVDTAVAPSHQGHGLFTRMTLGALPALADGGIDWIFNTPNAKSMPGYLKMGWVSLGAVRASIIPANPVGAYRALNTRAASADLWPLACQGDHDAADWDWEGWRRPTSGAFGTSIDGGYLSWRFGSPDLGYRVWVAGRDKIVVGRVRQRGSASELSILEVLTRGSDSPVGARSTLRIVRDSAADYAIFCGPSARSLGVPAPWVPGPVVVVRPLRDHTMSCPLHTSDLTLGDVELF